MNRHAAFLRAINTGNRRATNAAMCAAVETTGAVDVSGVIASGNIVFSASRPSESRLEEALESALGFDVPVMLRSASAVRGIIARQPFDAEPSAVQVGVLKRRPTEEIGRAIVALTEDPCVVDGRELFWLPENGEFLGGLKVPEAERLAGPMTIRTLATVQRIDERLSG